MKTIGWPTFWRKKTVLSVFLLPFAVLYLFISTLHQFIRSKRMYYSSVPVISIGNITVGGSGKTPVIQYLAQYFSQQKHKVIIVSRGYGGSVTGTHIVSPQDKPALVGDEPAMLAKNLQKYGVKVVVGRCRQSAVQLAEENNATLILLDDGFSRSDIQKTADILVFDGNTLFGNGFVLPAGPLRCLKRKAKAADFSIVINPKSNTFIGVPAYRITANIDAKKLDKNHNYLAFCGLGYPKKFYTALKQQNIPLLDTFSFPDHHAYSAVDLANLQKQAIKHKALCLTTEKDFVKIPKEYQDFIQPVPLILAGDDLENITAEIEKKLR